MAEHQASSTTNGPAGGSVSGRQITRWVYGLAALLILLSAGSLTGIAHLAWREADRHALDMEQARFLDTIEDQVWELTRNQMTALQEPQVLNALSQSTEPGFNLTGFSSWLMHDFDLERAYLLGGNGSLTALQPEEEPGSGSRSKLSAKSEGALTQVLYESFVSPPLPPDMGLREARPQHGAVLDASVATIVLLDDLPAVVSALPIEPGMTAATIGQAQPAKLVGLLLLDTSWFQTMSNHYGFRDLRFYEGPPARERPTNLKILSANGDVIGYFRWNLPKPGLIVWMRALPLIIIMAAVIGLVAVFIARKISRLSACLEHSERRNRYFARHDSLTGLPNRHHFSDRIAYALDGVADKGFAVIACDLDRFKPVNDTYGHEAGDKVLRVIADRLETAIGSDGMAGRIGGDEFVLLLTNDCEVDSLRTFAKSLLASISRPIEIAPGQNVRIGISLGIALAPDCGTSETQLIRAADAALYQAKDNGRNTFRFSSAALNKEACAIDGSSATPPKQDIRSINSI